MYPKLVEYKIKNTIQHNLQQCHKLKQRYFNIFYNLCWLFLITGVVGAILYYKFKGNMDPKERQKRENMKRDYILYNLRKFQNINNKTITNIPFD